MMELQSLKLLNARQVAERFGMPVERVYALARQGLLPAVRLGRQVRFSAAALEEFVRNGGKALPGGWRREPREREGGGAA